MTQTRPYKLLFRFTISILRLLHWQYEVVSEWYLMVADLTTGTGLSGNNEYSATSPFCCFHHTTSYDIRSYAEAMGD